MNLKQFDAIEVWPTLVFDDPETGLYKETGDPENVIDWETQVDCIGVEWTVFGHLKSGGADAICACETKEQALEIQTILEKELKL